MEVTVVDAAGAGELLNYSADYVRTLYRRGQFPAPICPELPTRVWRWSVRAIEQYVERDSK